MSPLKLDFLSGRRLGFFGIGKTNAFLLSLLPESCSVVIRSETPLKKEVLTKAKISALRVGKEAFVDPSEEILFLSPSVRRERAEFDGFRRAGIRFCSDHELFFERVNSPVFAVTGSDGKSTVTTLCSMLLSERFHGAVAIGNIGVPMLSALNEERRAYAAELSSFMLSYGKYRVFRGTVTNISENHLDWHRDFEEYTEAKLSMFKRAEETVLNADDPISARFFRHSSPFAAVSRLTPLGELKRSFRAQVFYTVEDGYVRRDGEPLISLYDIKRSEDHSLTSLALALALTEGYVKRETAQRVAREFSGLEHRSELFLSKDGMDFINSSVDSTPKRTATTLESLKRRVILILGGRGKNLSYEPLVEPIKRWAKLVFICGENADEIERSLSGCCKTERADSPEHAAKIAVGLMKSGDTLLLSPASTSFDRYSDFEERGRKFKEVINSIFNNS